MTRKVKRKCKCCDRIFERPYRKTKCPIHRRNDKTNKK